MVTRRVDPEHRKSNAGAPRTVDFDAYVQMGKALVKWAHDPPLGSYFKNFILDNKQYAAQFTTDKIHYAIANCPEFAKLYEEARTIFARQYRVKCLTHTNRVYERLLPIIDSDYREWREREMKIAAISHVDPKIALSALLDQSDEPVKKKKRKNLDI